MKVIKFYRVEDEYGCFSNFAPYPISLEGTVWPTSKHYFQAQKFLDEAHREAIRNVKSPMIAARMGRSRKRPLRPDWEAVKDGVMRTAVLGRRLAGQGHDLANQFVGNAYGLAGAGRIRQPIDHRQIRQGGGLAD